MNTPLQVIYLLRAFFAPSGLPIRSTSAGRLEAAAPWLTCCPSLDSRLGLRDCGGVGMKVVFAGNLVTAAGPWRTCCPSLDLRLGLRDCGGVGMTVVFAGNLVMGCVMTCLGGRQSLWRDGILRMAAARTTHEFETIERSDEARHCSMGGNHWPQHM
jgi:hypothetical protein